MGKRGANGPAMRHNHNILAFQKGRQAFQHGGNARLHFAEALPTGRMFLTGMGPEGMRRARQQRMYYQNILRLPPFLRQGFRGRLVPSIPLRFLAPQLQVG